MANVPGEMYCLASGLSKNFTSFANASALSSSSLNLINQGGRKITIQFMDFVLHKTTLFLFFGLRH